MVDKEVVVRRLADGGALAMVVLLAGCGYAKRDQVQAQLDELRQEMAAEDQALGGRVDQVDSQVSQLSSRLDALETELNSLRDEFDVTVNRLEGMVAFDVPVHFEFDEAEVRPEDQGVLDRFAEVVQEFYPNAVVTVEGFTDAAGSAEYNLRLGQMRAESVKIYLTDNGGLPAERVRTVSYGEADDRLIAPSEAGEDEGEVNRRVSLVIDYTGPVAPPTTATTATQD